jgi:hypothetical protein
VPARPTANSADDQLAELIDRLRIQAGPTRAGPSAKGAGAAVWYAVAETCGSERRPLGAGESHNGCSGPSRRSSFFQDVREAVPGAWVPTSGVVRGGAAIAAATALSLGGGGGILPARFELRFWRPFGSKCEEPMPSVKHDRLGSRCLPDDRPVCEGPSLV